MSLTYQSDLADRGPVSPERALWHGGLAWYEPCKVVTDRIVASVMLTAALPLILIMMGLVKATSRGPAIYKQRRLGLGGKCYDIYKIRTMRHDCERLTGARWAAKSGDSRVTPVGRLLRVTHLDELPQLWNVIRGDMSLVGPRPERPEFVPRLEKAIPNYHDRMVVRPGITGLAQVQLPADEKLEDVRRKVVCDICYIQKMNPWLDLKILAGTALKIAGVSFQFNRRLLNLPGADGEEFGRSVDTANLHPVCMRSEQPA
jgi:lipopolysaccharide/colanic/teichoic acid biosynthesis glycosyltransferase